MADTIRQFFFSGYALDAAYVLVVLVLVAVARHQGWGNY